MYLFVITKAFYLEEIVRPGKVICFKNLLIKKDSFSCDLVTATYNDLSVAFSNPKELYFQEAAKCLQNQIKVRTVFKLYLLILHP